jgi:hypothetical protein
MSAKGTLRQVFICLRPRPLLGFCLGRCSNFLGFEFGQIKVLNSGRIWSPTEPISPPPLHTVYVYTVYLFTQGRGVRVDQREG